MFTSNTTSTKTHTLTPLTLLLLFQLGLPLTSIKLLSVYATIGSYYDIIDLQDFVNQIAENVEQDKQLPLLVIANAGSHNCGQCDNIQMLEKICIQNKIWQSLYLDLTPKLRMNAE